MGDSAIGTPFSPCNSDRVFVLYHFPTINLRKHACNHLINVLTDLMQQSQGPAQGRGEMPDTFANFKHLFLILIICQ